jgi:4'-phosphopantetheinyl transferase
MTDVRPVSTIARRPQRPPRTAVPLIDGTVEVVVTRLEAADEAVGSAMPILSGAERRRADRFVYERDRGRYVVARARLRQLLGARLAVRPESVELVCGAYGKPALAPRFADSRLRFNLSHRDDVAVYAFASESEVGVDVEAVRALRDAGDLAARFFSPRENEAYRALDPRDRPLGFFNCWTRKEAFVKALGEGLSYPLHRFDVSLAPGEPARILHVADAPGRHHGWRMEGFSPAAGFVAAVVTRNARWGASVWS